MTQSGGLLVRPIMSKQGEKGYTWNRSPYSSQYREKLWNYYVRSWLNTKLFEAYSAIFTQQTIPHLSKNIREERQSLSCGKTQTLNGDVFEERLGQFLLAPNGGCAAGFQANELTLTNTPLT